LTYDVCVSWFLSSFISPVAWNAPCNLALPSLFFSLLSAPRHMSWGTPVCWGPVFVTGSQLGAAGTATVRGYDVDWALRSPGGCFDSSKTFLGSQKSWWLPWLR
jgi:hypothetical protein